VTVVLRESSFLYSASGLTFRVVSPSILGASSVFASFSSSSLKSGLISGNSHHKSAFFGEILIDWDEFELVMDKGHLLWECMHLGLHGASQVYNFHLILEKVERESPFEISDR
jgi:hypothetical protein